ncbi:MAG: zinc metalloprotease HtpX [Acidimicrobiia bacterium]
MFKNSLKTAVLMAAMGGLIMGISSFFGRSGLLIGAVLAFAMVGGSYWFSDKLAIAQAHAVPVAERDAPQLFAAVRDLCTVADMPMPRIYMTPDQQPNAFATGRNERHAVVAVTQGLLEVLTPEEVKGVLAHELSHIRHRDILIGSVAAAMAMAITLVARMAMFGAMFGGRSDDRDSNPIAEIAMLILAPVAAGLIQMAVSRSREFEADRGAKELIGTGEPLATALEKLDAYSKRIPMNVNPAQASAYIVNPLTGQNVSFKNLFSTHPSMEARIARLREIN